MFNFPDNISVCFRRSLPGVHVSRYPEFSNWTFGRRSEEAEAAPAGPDRRGGVGLKRLCQQRVVNVPEVGGGFEVATYQSALGQVRWPAIFQGRRRSR